LKEYQLGENDSLQERGAKQHYDKAFTLIDGQFV